MTLWNKAQPSQNLKIAAHQYQKQNSLKSVWINFTTKEKKKQLPSSPTNTYSRSIVCKGNHRLWDCKFFKEKTPTQLVADNKLCFSCLRDKHTSGQCLQPKKCPAEECKSSHNTLLHGADRVLWKLSFYQFPLPFSPLATPVKVKQLLVNSSLMPLQQCHLLLMLWGSFRWLNCV